MLCVAIFSALAAPIIRWLSLKQWQQFGAVVLTATVVIAVSIFTNIRLHKQIEKRAGRFLFSYSDVKPKAFTYAYTSILIAGVVLWVVFAWYVDAVRGEFAPTRFLLIFLSFGIPLAQQIVLLYQPARFGDTYRLYENGVVWAGTRLVPWDKVHILRWKPEFGWLTWSLSGQYGTLTIRDADRQRFDEIFRQYAVSLP
jgi:hypothetical protein